MLEQFLKALSEQAVQAATPKVFRADPEPPHVYMLADPFAEEVKLLAAEPRPRAHKASSLQAVVAFAARHRDSAAVWFSRRRVVCVVDDATRRDLVTLDLDLSPQMKAVLGLEARKPLSQRDLILLLRTTFAACLGPCGDLVNLLRSVRFRSAVDGESTVKHGQRSVGKAVEAAIEGTAQIPEYVAFELPVFATAFPFCERVRLALEPDPGTETFTLIPLPGEVEWAVARAEHRVGEVLADHLAGALADDDGKEVPVYYGDPGPVG